MRIDNERVYTCPDCRDTGWVSVVDPVYWPKKVRGVSAVCSCAAGDAVSEARSKNKRRGVARVTARMIFWRPGMKREDVEQELELIRQLPQGTGDEYEQQALDF